MYCIQKAGSDRTTINGWTSWKTQEGKFLAQLRSDYLRKKEKDAEQEAAADRR
jgi:parvulin-like peptidyl-prolyl isomerase